MADKDNGVLQIPAGMGLNTEVREVACLTCGRRIWNIDKPLDLPDVEKFIEEHKGHDLTTAEFGLPPVCRPEKGDG